MSTPALFARRKFLQPGGLKLLRVAAQFRNLKARNKQDGLGRTLNYVCKRLDIDPVHGRRVATGLKTLAHPGEWVGRRRISDLVGHTGGIRIQHGIDHLALPVGVLQGANTLVERLAGQFERKREEVERNYEPPFSILLETEATPHGPRLLKTEDWKSVVDFAALPQIVGIVAEYLQQIPVLSVVSFVYTMPGTGLIGSQLFHCDMNHARQLHLVVPIEEIDDQSGPFSFFPGDTTEKVLRQLNYRQGRLSDADVFRVVDPEKLLRANGPPGSAFFINPARCLHFGARASTKTRLMLILNYTCYNEGAEGLSGVYRAINRDVFDTGDPIRKALLRL
jgi:hypothetical protein